MIDYERQAITSTQRLPQAPGPNAHPIYCEGKDGRCRQKLGMADGRHIFVRHNGREATYSLPAEVQCERCGHRTMLYGRAA
jgi:DNA-directed RNA polymerase subunit RPC12/RpoP